MVLPKFHPGILFEGEIVKEPPNFPGYGATSFGRIITKKGKICEAKPKPNGYIDACRTKAHLIIADAFLPPGRSDQIQIHHKYRNRSNNKPENLERVTPKENNDNRAEFDRSVKKRQIAVNQLDDDLKIIGHYNSMREAANSVGGHPGGISKATINGCRHRNYYWKVVDIEYPNEKDTKILEIGKIDVYISRNGLVWWGHEKPTYGSKTGGGYLSVNISGDQFLVHRLVLLAFDYREDYEELIGDHIDSDTKNNNFENLQWLYQGDNVRKAHEKEVLVYDLDGNYIESYRSMTCAAESLFISISGVSRVCGGSLKQHCGYIFKFSEEKI